MCLAVPAKVIEILPDQMALVDMNGAQRETCMMLLEGDVRPGDFVLIHVGYAIEKLNEEEARKTLALFAEMSLLDPVSENTSTSPENAQETTIDHSAPASGHPSSQGGESS